ncbi:MAG TPA: Asd/ArgC dimerization domain-containing protein [Terriglobales bacterium]
MSSDTKLAAHVDPARSPLYRVAIVGAGSLKGKEIADVLNERNFPSTDVKLLDDDESLGQLESVGDEVTFIQKVRADEFQHVDFTFFASDAECTARTWKTARDTGSAIVDLSYALEDEPEATVRSPWLERQLGQLPAPQLQPGPAVVAHPAAVVLALLIDRLRKAIEIRNVAATIFEPASEHGQKGMDELHEQTVNLLSFQELPKKVFDIQVAFNMVSRYGEKSSPSLEAIEHRVVRHYAKIAGKDALAPSILMLQAPIFHGQAFALHIESGGAADLERVAQALAGEHVHIAQGAEEAPTNVNAAGQNDIQVAVRPDGARANAFWIWAASDNLRVAAATAVECAETMAATRPPQGKIQ